VSFVVNGVVERPHLMVSFLRMKKNARIIFTIPYFTDWRGDTGETFASKVVREFQGNDVAANKANIRDCH
jgi:hypothetical protein